MSEIKLDLDDQILWIGDRKYFYEENESYDSDEPDDSDKLHWFRESKKYYVPADSECDDHEKVTSEEIEKFQISGEEIMRARIRIKDRDKIRKLNRIFRKARPKALAERKAKEEERGRAENSEEEEERGKQRRYREEDEARERKQETRKTRENQDSGSSSSSDSEATTDDVPRTKWGTRITSNDGKHFFGVGVWKSTQYEGCSTVRLSVAGKNCLYTLDETQMKALRREISRGVPT